MKIKGFFLRQILSSSRIRYESLFLPNSHFYRIRYESLFYGNFYRCLCIKYVANGEKMNLGLGNIFAFGQFERVCCWHILFQGYIQFGGFS
ncbi:hypothetical protein OROHE_018051 [Orobanche hederae]